MRRPLLLLPLSIALGACEAKSPPADATATPVADTTTAPVAATPTATDAGAAPRDTTPAAPSAGGTTATKTTPAAPAPTYIGRDSAFGPTFTVDPTGKVTPIDPTKKKP